MKTIICTTGTSIAAPIDVGRIDSAKIGERLENLRGCTDTEGQYLIKASAESHSLFRMNLDPGDTIHLLHTQTEDGKTCALALKALISNSEELGQTAQLHEVSGLQVEDRDRFRKEGIDNLFKILDKISKPRLDRGQHDVWLNVTGGFKSVVPYVTLFGLLYRLPVVYIFERSNTLITLPPAAINFDFERLAQVDDAIHRLIEKGAMRKDDFFDTIPDLDHPKRDWISTLLEEEDGHVTLSAFGLLALRVINREFSSVHLSPNAQEAYDRSGGNVRRHFTTMLDRVPNPVWRQQKIHSFHGTDLTVFKPGSTSERMAAFMHNDEVYVCELYQHDQYERELPGRNRADYPLRGFKLWSRPADQKVSPGTEEEEYRRLEEENRRFEDDLKAANQLLEESRQESESAACKHKSREGKLQEQVKELRDRSDQLEQELKQYRSRVPWWRRVFRWRNRS